MEVSISGEDFLINGAITYPGRTNVSLVSGGTANLEGLLLNSRMINAVFDDDNAATLDNWAYPSGPAEAWNPTRHTNEFAAAVPSYAAKGIKLLSIGLQGGLPTSSTHPEVGDPPAWIVSAFNSNGTLKAAWMTRLATALNACRNAGIVAKVQMFYFRGDSLLTNEAAINAAVDNASDWLVNNGYGSSVLFSTHNELGHSLWNTHAINENNRAHEVVDRVKARHPSLLVGLHMVGQPTAAIMSSVDWLGFSGNEITPAGKESYIDTVRAMAAFIAEPKPILCLEDSPDSVAAPDAENQDACLRKGASHGFYELTPGAGGLSNYVDGLQAVPVNWSPTNTTAKANYFNRCQTYAGL